MPLMPKRTKHRKVQKGRMRGKATRGNRVTDGEYGIQAVTAGLITSNQIEAWNSSINRSFSNRKSNRSCSYCNDTLYKKRWKSLD